MNAAAATAEAIAAMVATIGTDGFAANFHGALRRLGGADLSSVFLHDRNDHARLILTGGQHPKIADFPLRASLAYAHGFWRSDREINQAVRAETTHARLVHKTASRMPPGPWRRQCYDEAEVIERISIIGARAAHVVINGYRLAGQAGFTPGQIEALEIHAPILMAAMNRDIALRRQPGKPMTEGELAQSLAEPRYGLSLREAEVASAMMLGQTQQEIAARKRIAPETVITYRRRAYGKLGIANRRELQSLHSGLIASQAGTTG